LPVWEASDRLIGHRATQPTRYYGSAEQNKHKRDFQAQPKLILKAIPLGCGVVFKMSFGGASDNHIAKRLQIN
jgi:hypothetical protein